MTEHAMNQRQTHSLLSAIRRSKFNAMEQYRYSFAELTDMHLVYGEVRTNALAAERLYRERFPNRYHPSRRVFISLDPRMRETGSLQRRHEGPDNMKTTRTPEFEEEVLGRDRLKRDFSFTGETVEVRSQSR